MGSLSGGVALVTGASRGIGRALAIALAGEGMAVGLLGRDRDALEETAVECGGLTHVVVADVNDRTAVRRAVTEVEQSVGPIDLLVNNAGVIESSEVPFAEDDPDVVWSVIETDLRGPLLLSHAVLESMRARGSGRIVNINSGFGYRPRNAYTGYSVAKGALSRLTHMLAHQHPELTVLDVSPGLVRTDMTEAMPMWQDAPADAWTPPERVCDVIVAVAQGKLDALSGRFIHAGKDDVETLLAHADQMREGRTRIVTLLSYGPDDPLT